jgi:hypothetical protein
LRAIDISALKAKAFNRKDRREKDAEFAKKIQVEATKL